MMLNNNLSHFWGSIYEKTFFYPNLSAAKGQILIMKYLIYMACCIFLLTSATSCNKFKPDYSGGKAVALKNGQVWVGQGRGTVNNWGIGMDMSFYAYNRFGELRQNLSFRKIPAKGGTYSLFNSNSQLQDSLSGCNFFTISHDGDVL